MVPNQRRANNQNDEGHDRQCTPPHYAFRSISQLKFVFYSTSGTHPNVSDNVHLHVGWFEDTLPKFLDEHPQPVAFVHIDSDLYSSANTVLWGLKDRLRTGSIIVFDEYFNYPYWREHEYKAFAEFVDTFDIAFEYIGYAVRGYSVAVKILEMRG